MVLSRRQFITLMSLGAAGAAFSLPFKRLHPAAWLSQVQASATYGPLRRDPDGLLDLPVGFRYRVFSREGDRMSDGSRVPGRHDGMGAFADAAGNTVLVRNHELAPRHAEGIQAPPDRQYDPLGKGGTTTLIVSPDRQLLRHYVSLAGTVQNCAGGTTPWGSWVSSEETTLTPAENSSLHPDRVSKRHGYNFEVPATAAAPVVPKPLIAMGRFRHEAIAVDPRTGIVYQTEDREDGLFYRFIPATPGRLEAGRLEALRIPAAPQAITRAQFPQGIAIAVDWVPIEDVDPPEDTVRLEGFRKGAAQFSRGEGICYSDGMIYFTCTNGGNVPHGQVWRYVPGHTPEAGGTLELFVQPDDPNILDYPDNLVMAPWGDLLVCEDGGGEQYIVGIKPNGTCYPFARNALNMAEFAGVCFSPDGRTLFVNLYQPGMTFAIWSEAG